MTKKTNLKRKTVYELEERVFQSARAVMVFV
jgi:hypothetical protein